MVTTLQLWHQAHSALSRLSAYDRRTAEACRCVIQDMPGAGTEVPPAALQNVLNDCLRIVDEQSVIWRRSIDGALSARIELARIRDEAVAMVKTCRLCGFELPVYDESPSPFCPKCGTKTEAA